MELPLGLQGSQFLWSIALGLAYGLHYDLLRGLRRNVRFLTHLADLWFVLTFLLGNLLFALFVGNGELRIFMFLGSVLGLTLWLWLVSRYAVRIFAAFWRVLTAPVRLVWRFFEKIIEKLKIFLKNLFSIAKKSVTIRRKLQKKTKSGGSHDAPVQIITHHQADHTGRDDLRHRHHRSPPSQDRQPEKRTRRTVS